MKYKLNKEGRVIMDAIDEIREKIGCSFICDKRIQENGNIKYTVVVDKEISIIKKGNKISETSSTEIVPTEIGDYVIKFTMIENEINIDTVFRVEDTREHYPLGLILQDYNDTIINNLLASECIPF